MIDCRKIESRTATSFSQDKMRRVLDKPTCETCEVRLTLVGMTFCEVVVIDKSQIIEFGSELKMTSGPEMAHSSF